MGFGVSRRTDNGERVESHRRVADSATTDLGALPFPEPFDEYVEDRQHGEVVAAQLGHPNRESLALEDRVELRCVPARPGAQLVRR